MKSDPKPAKKKLGRRPAAVPTTDIIYLRVTAATAAIIREGATKAGAVDRFAVGEWMRQALIEAAAREPGRSKKAG